MALGLKLKEILKKRTGRLWPWLTLPVRLARAAAGLFTGWRRRRTTARTVAVTIRWLRELVRRLRQPQVENRISVAVDISPFWEPLTGVGRYLYQLLEHLSDSEAVELHLFGPTMFVDRDDDPPKVVPPQGRAVQHVVIDVPDTLVFGCGWWIRVLRRLEPMLFAWRGHQVIFAPNFLPPPKFRWGRGALVLTVHDLAVHRFPWTLEEETWSALDRSLKASLRRASAVITPSRTVREELIEQTGIEPALVTAVHHGTGHVNTVQDIELPPGTPESFALWVGTLEPRKNLPTLLRAWKKLDRSGTLLPVLVLCGRWGWKSEDLREEVRRGEEEGWLLHFGYVEEAALAQLYARAQMLLCPSLYEGFGLPAIEALAAGCPVVCSDIPVFREVVGSAGLYAEATDTEEWASRIRRLLAEPELAESLAAEAKVRARAFDWSRAAVETVEVWRGAMRTSATGGGHQGSS